MAPARHHSRLVELTLGVATSQGRLDEDRRHPAQAKLDAKAGRAVAPCYARLHPLEGERAVVDMPASDEIVHDSARDGLGSAAALQSGDQLSARPGSPREQVSSGQPRRPLVEDRTRAYLAGVTARSPYASRIFASRSPSTAGFSCSHFLAFSRP